MKRDRWSSAVSPRGSELDNGDGRRKVASGRRWRGLGRATRAVVLAGLGLALVVACRTAPPPPDPEPVTLTVTVTANGGASGTVVSSPLGIDVTSGSQSAEFPPGTIVRLAATAGEDSSFGGFAPAGVCASGAPATTCVVELASATSIEATFLSDPGLPPFPDQLDIVATAPVAGAYLEFTVPAGVSVIGVAPLRDGVLARVSSTSGGVRVSWVGAEAQDADQLRIDFETDASIVGAPEVVSARVLGSHTGPDLGASTLSLASPSGAAASTVPLLVDPVEHGEASLLASYADHPLGDVDGDGSLDVRDALWLLERTIDGAWTDFERYHADLDADDLTDALDLQRILDKLVDPELPAQLHVKPSSVTFVQLDPATAEDAIVLIANQGRAPLEGLWWTPPDGVVDTEVGGIAGHSVALRLTLPAAARRGWLPGFLRVEHAAETADVRVGNLVFLVAGQSNAVGLGAPLDGGPEAPHAGVRMLGNDYLWRDATEPLDDATGQLDPVSDDGDFVRYSFGTRLGNLLHEATGYPVYLIPAAKGSTYLYDGAWDPTSPLFRGTLFGSANYRAQVSAGLQPNPVASQPFPAEGGPVSAVVWYQGESDRSGIQRSVFVANTNEVMDAFAAQLGAPTIAVQVATQCRSDENTRIHAVSELQRRMETGYGDLAREGFHLVVAFDLPRSDCIHLSAYGQRVLAERIDLAVREHVLGETVDGTGPRMVSLSHSGDVVTLRTTHTLEPGNLNPGFFTVWNGPPQGSLDSEGGGYYDNVIPVLLATRSNTNPTAVNILLGAPVSSGQVPHVRYMSPVKLPCCSSTDPSDESVWGVVASGTIRAAGGGLPLPAFGPLPPFTAP